MHDVERSADWLMFCRHQSARSTYKCLENRPLFLGSRLKFDRGFHQWDNDSGDGSDANGGGVGGIDGGGN